jgi:small subunit ribosomal protein S6
MYRYEHIFIARQELNAEQIKGLTTKFETVITDNGGTVDYKEDWGLKTLAYRIEKNRKGYYVMFYVEAPAATMDELKRQTLLNEDIIRHITIRVDEFGPKPSVMMAKEEKSESSGHRSRAPRPRSKGDE